MDAMLHVASITGSPRLFQSADVIGARVFQIKLPQNDVGGQTHGALAFPPNPAPKPMPTKADASLPQQRPHSFDNQDHCDGDRHVINHCRQTSNYPDQRNPKHQRRKCIQLSQ